MQNADLYLDQIDFSRYLSEAECKKCGASSCKQLVETLRTGQDPWPQLQPLPEAKAMALGAALEAMAFPPQVPKLQHPRPVAPGVVEFNGPENGDPILVTGNSQLTQEVLMTAIASVSSPFFLLSIDCNGDTVDMAVILGSFTPGAVAKCCESERLIAQAVASPLILPGRAALMAGAVAAATGRSVESGPICAMELPLFLSMRE